MSRVFNNNAANFLRATFAASKELPVTIFFWNKVADLGASPDTYVAFAKTAGSNNESIRANTANADQFAATATDSAAAASNATLTLSGLNSADGIWCATMTTFTSSTSRQTRAFFPREASTVNGTSRATAALIELYIGQTAAAAAPLGSSLAELAIWNSALGDTEYDLLVTAAATGVRPSVAVPANILAYYSFATDTGATIADESGAGGPTLTVNGTVAFSSDHPTITTGVKKRRTSLMGLG